MQHIVTVSNICTDTFTAAIAGRKARIFYSDPPWGDGNLKMWATLSAKGGNPVPDQISFSQLLDRLAFIIQGYVNGFVFIEMGERWRLQTSLALAKAGVTFTHEWRVSYRSGNKLLPNTLLGGVTSLAFRIPDVNVDGLRGAALPDAVISAIAEPGALVIDPCCGKGYTARAAVRHGMMFAGNELDPKRAAKTKAAVGLN